MNLSALFFHIMFYFAAYNDIICTNMEITKKERAQLIDDIANAVIKKLSNKKKLANEEQDEWVTTKEAAELLHVSDRYLRHIKDRFPHVKSGENGQGCLRFLKKGLLSNYVNG